MRRSGSALFPPRWPLLGLAALLLVSMAVLALAWVGTSPAGAQDDGLQVSISANPANPPVNEPTTLTATINNPPLEGKPVYDWQIDFGDGNWFSVGSNPTLRYLAGEAETLGFRVTVSYGSGESATSEPITVTWVEAGEEPTPEPTEEPTPTPEPTPEPTPDPTEEPPEPPPAPAGLTATGGDTVIELVWTDPADGAITKYQVRVSADGGATWDPDWTDISGSGAATTSHTLTGLTNDTEYTIELRALRGQTGGAASSATATPRPEPPPAPARLTATGGDTTIDLRWTDPSDSAISGYQVRVSADGRATWDPDWTDISGSGAATTSHTLTGLTSDIEYAIELRALRGASSAGPAARATATPSEPAPAEEPTPTPEPTPSAEDGYEPDSEVIDDVWEYAKETDEGHVHVLRWMRVLKTLGAVGDMTAAQARDNADQYSADRWDPVVEELEKLERAQGDYEPDQEVVKDVRGYAKETKHGFDHVLRWVRVLKTFGAIADITAAEAQGYADQGWERWDPVAAELADLEAATPPNRAPVVNTQAANYAGLGDNKVVNYAGFIGNNNAPRGVMVWKKMEGIFTDPDGDELTYTVSFTSDRSELVNWVVFSEATQRVWIEMDGDTSWKSVRPELPNPLITTVTLTATDPEGLSASVSGNFSTRWGIYPEVVSAVASAQAIELTFDLEVEANPAPGPSQFTVRVVNADGTEGTVAVSGVAVNGKVVTLELGSALEEGQTVTVDYYYGYQGGTPLQQAGGGDYARNFSGQAVAWSSLEPPGVPQNFAVSVTLGSLDVRARWDVVEGATSYLLRWRQSGGEFKPANEISVTETGATITLSGSGQWEVRLQGCNGDGCGLEVSQTVETVVPAVWLDLTQARDETGQVRPRTFTATWDPVEGAASYTLGWRRVGTGTNSQALSPPDDARQTGGASGPSGEDGRGASRITVPGDQTSTDFTVPDDGDYEAELNAWGSGNELIGQGRSEVDPAADQGDTTPPRLVRGEIDGNIIAVYFSEALDQDAVGGYFRVILDSVSQGGEFTAEPMEVKISGNKVVLVDFASRGMQWRRIGSAESDSALLYYYPGPAWFSDFSSWWRRGLDSQASPQAQRTDAGTSTATLRDLYGNEVWTPYQDPAWLSRTRSIELQNLTQPPSLQRATAHARWLTLTFDEALYGNSVPAASAFTVMVNDSAVSLASAEPVAVSGDTVTLVLAAAMASTDVVRVSYGKPPGNPLRGVDGEVRSFSNESVTNQVGAVPSVSGVAITSVPAGHATYAHGETIRVQLTFSEAVDVDTAGGTPRLKIKMDLGYGEKWADYAGGSGSTELTFAYTVVDPNRSTRGVAVLQDTLDLNGGAIRSVGTGTGAHLWYGGLGHDPSHMVDWRRSAPGMPWVTGVAISSGPVHDDTYKLGDTIQVTATFSEAVDVDSTSGMPRLKIKMDPHYGEKWATYASGSGTASLTFAYTVVAANRSTRGVAVLRNTLDLNGGTIRSATAPWENAHLRYEGLGHDRNHRVDGKIPRLLTVAAAGNKVALTYDDPLDEHSVPPASAFTVKRTPQGGDEETVGLSGTPAIGGGAVVLTLADPVLGTDTDVKVSYTKPTAAADNKLRDKTGNEAESFTDQGAEPADTTQPRLVRGEIDGDTITLYFSEALDEDSVGGLYRVKLWGGHKGGGISFWARGPVEVSGNEVSVVLGNNRRSNPGEYANVIYSKFNDPTIARLRDLAGNEVWTPQIWNGRPSTWSLDLDNFTLD